MAVFPLGVFFIVDKCYRFFNGSIKNKQTEEEKMFFELSKKNKEKIRGNGKK